ncbi:S9 family peptidase [Polymorphobacter fuscus]|uniref:Prolyl oligopeptidase family serine peptidase n=1 Tax=Sandarakinorhabdus fusca TaxID=1439888 RepID=A0A7C9KV92_9SPHN|nr:prolyl oligopeptidase family serine peptidase [Polymorphobacter fuscus]KAB7648528.1 S9 family peptidase [Polymorphobacter fuscus]MQT16065.1 prolyl oligopeptidase family serine peptidase [Polymorphobacter fuscus]NJC07657.1 dipeptidyl aminopeptidase/acylaminoacyl peptidase [Polymorphobacter fuscus]
MRPLFVAALLATPAFAQDVVLPAAITAEGIPAIPAALAAQIRPYLEYRSAQFQDWDPQSRAMLVTTRFGGAAQVHRVSAPGSDRAQLSFEGEPIASARFSPDGKTILVTKDVGGGEFFQLYTLAEGRLTLLTDGKSRNTGATWSRDGRRVGYTSTRRNGADGDLWLIDPADPKSDRMVAQMQGGGWSFADFHPDGKTALVSKRSSIERSDLYAIDLASGRLTPLTPANATASYQNARYAPDGTIYVTSDVNSDVQRLGTLDARRGFRPLGTATPKWDVEDFDLAPDASFIAAVSNEAGSSVLRLIAPATGAVLGTAKLPAGVITGLKVAPWGSIGFSLASATSPADAWSLDPNSLATTRWTMSETGGLDASKNREPELITVKSFDGLPVSGFLYSPDPARFPGKRPLIIDIHGGPESQTRPGYLGRTNYLINEKGIAVFYPNVRGSSGYGKRFAGLDNGPSKREDSVKDIGAFLDALTARPDIDATRVAETGGSYGGYMCYATAIKYGDRLKGAICARPISNFVTLLENTESYRRELRRVEYGDERVPAQRAKLMAISPLTHVKDIKIPLVVVTGSNDPRVKPSESIQMVDAVRAGGGQAWHLIAANEGHGYQKKENQDYEFLTRLVFWDRTLLK